MKLLWVKSDFLHPTTRGGQIRTLELLRRLHRWHEIHYVALHDGLDPEGPERSSEYSAFHYAIRHSAPRRGSVGFALQLAGGLVSTLPLAITRYVSKLMRERIAELTRRIGFDAIVCDFPTVAPNIPELAPCVLFQHNVEYLIWERHTDNAPTAAHRGYFRLQTQRMFNFERSVCQSVRRIIAVSDTDARRMEQDFNVRGVLVTPTGVDAEYFAPDGSQPSPAADLVFVGSMDWMPNEDGMLWFAKEVLPRIHARRPGCTLTITGRKPGPAIQELARRDSRIQVTGTVKDVRPSLWGSRVSIVPLRIGGGTRLKIYEAMAAGVPVVSTAIGAEGLNVTQHENIRLADNPEDFSQSCLELLDDAALRERIVRNASALVTQHYSWDVVARQFGELLL